MREVLETRMERGYVHAQGTPLRRRRDDGWPRARERGEPHPFVADRFVRRWTKPSSGQSPPFAASTTASPSPRPRPVAEAGDPFNFPIARSSVSRSPRQPSEPALDFPPAPRALRDEKGDIADLRRRLALLETENAVLRNYVTEAQSQPGELVRELRRQVRELTLSRDAAQTALVDMQERNMVLQRRLDAAVQSQRDEERSASAKPERRQREETASVLFAKPSLRDAQEPRRTASEHSDGVSTVSAVSSRRSRTAEDREVPSSEAVAQPAYLASRHLHFPESAGKDSGRSRTSQETPLSTRGESALSASRFDPSRLSWDGVAALVQRSQRLREIVSARKAGDTSAFSLP